MSHRANHFYLVMVFQLCSATVVGLSAFPARCLLCWLTVWAGTGTGIGTGTGSGLALPGQCPLASSAPCMRIARTTRQQMLSHLAVTPAGP